MKRAQFYKYIKSMFPNRNFDKLGSTVNSITHIRRTEDASQYSHLDIKDIKPGTEFMEGTGGLKRVQMIRNDMYFTPYKKTDEVQRVTVSPAKVIVGSDLVIIRPFKADSEHIDYLYAYLNLPEIIEFINSLKNNNDGYTLQESLRSLPIPVFNDVPKLVPLSFILNSKRQIVDEVKEIEKIMESLLLGARGDVGRSINVYNSSVGRTAEQMAVDSGRLYALRRIRKELEEIAGEYMEADEATV